MKIGADHNIFHGRAGCLIILAYIAIVAWIIYVTVGCWSKPFPTDDLQYPGVVCPACGANMDDGITCFGDCYFEAICPKCKRQYQWGGSQPYPCPCPQRAGEFAPATEPAVLDWEK